MALAHPGSDEIRALQWQLAGAQALLLTLGLIGVATASPERIVDHALKVALATAATLIASRLRVRAYLLLITPAWAISILLLVAVLIFGQGSAEGGATRRWLGSGALRFQPSEFARLALTLQLASVFARRGVHSRLLSPTLMVLATTALIILEPDLGSSVLTFGAGVGMLYLAGVRAGNLLTLGLMLTPLAIFGADRYLAQHPYILARLHGHQQRDQAASEGLDQIGLVHRDMQLGGLWGHGIDGPRWQYFAAHTDMIIASIGFSGGLLSVALLMLAYASIATGVLRAARLAGELTGQDSEDRAAALMASGAMLAILLQAITNLGVAAGILPVTGVPLPLVSYGFSSMLACSLALGVAHAGLRHIRRRLEGPVHSR